MRIKVKPLSVNECWQGKRFKSVDYKRYEQELLYTLKPLTIPEGKLKVHYTFGVSSKNADIDNPVKPFQDILQKKYDFKDNRIYKIVIDKVDVGKGEEFIEFEILPYDGR